MRKQDILARLSDSEYIYGYMYGRKCGYARLDKIIQIKTKSLRIWEEGMVYVWGWPGPDYNLYRYDDYGKTWAFSKEEIK